MKTYIFLCSNYLGDTIQTLPALRELKKDAKIICIIPDYLLPAFETIQWIDEFFPFNIKEISLSTEEEDGLTLYEVENISERIVNYISNFKNASLLTTVRLSSSVREKIPCLSHDYRNPINVVDKPPYFCFAFAFPYMLGVKIKNYNLEIGFQKKEVEVKSDLNIGISLGSLTMDKRLPRSDLDIILEKTKKYNRYVFGIGSKKIESIVEKTGAKSLVNANRFVGLNETLNYLSKMDIFISPDSGLLHCALAMGVKTVMLPLKTKTPEPWMVAHPKYLNKLLLCKDINFINDVINDWAVA